MKTNFKLIVKNAEKNLPIEIDYVHDPEEQYPWNYLTRALESGASDATSGMLDLSENMTLGMFNIFLQWQRIRKMTEDEFRLAIKESTGFFTPRYKDRDCFLINDKYSYPEMYFGVQVYGGYAHISHNFHLRDVVQYMLYCEMYDFPDLSRVITYALRTNLSFAKEYNLDIQYKILGEKLLSQNIMELAGSYIANLSSGQYGDFETIFGQVCIASPNWDGNQRSPTSTDSKPNKVFYSILFIAIDGFDNFSLPVPQKIEWIIAFDKAAKKYGIDCRLEDFVTKYVELHRLNLEIKNLARGCDY